MSPWDLDQPLQDPQIPSRSHLNQVHHPAPSHQLEAVVFLRLFGGGVGAGDVMIGSSGAIGATELNWGPSETLSLFFTGLDRGWDHWNGGLYI